MIYHLLNYVAFITMTNAASISSELPPREDKVTWIAKDIQNKEAIGMLFNGLFEESLNIYSPISDAFDNDLCRNHSLLYKEGVKSNILWALTMFDASAKIPSGLLTGNLYQLGNFDECLELENIDSIYGKFSGKHCMVAIGDRNFFTELTILEKADAGLQNVHFPRRDRLQEVYNIEESAIGVTWSLCIPSSCKPRDLELHLRNVLHDVLGNTSIRVDELGCNSRADPPMNITILEIIFVILTVLFGVAILSSTTYDLQSRRVKSQLLSNLFLSFSLYTNGRKLLSSATKPGTLAAVDGIRVISMLGIILIHVFTLFTYVPTINLNHVQQLSVDWVYIFIINGSFFVEAFFLLSGALLCYNFLKDRENRVKLNLIRFYVRRYIRLTPVYVLIILLTVVFPAFSNAKANVQITKESCWKNGWAGPLYISNFVDIQSPCAIASWYLAIDMQLFWLSPLIIFPLSRKPKLGIALVGATIIISLITAFMVSYIHEIHINSYIYLKMESKEYSHLYFPTYTRCSSWLIGICLGYLLHTTRNTSLHLSRGVTSLGWLLSACLILGSWLTGNHFFQPNYQYDRLWTSMYTALSRPGFTLGLAWVVFACVKGYGGFLNTFLSWQVFHVLSRICYSMYMMHTLIAVYYTILIKTSQHYNDVSLIVQFLGITVVSSFSALAVCLIVEMPCINLGNFLLGTAINESRVTPPRHIPEIADQNLQHMTSSFTKDVTLSIHKNS